MLAKAHASEGMTNDGIVKEKEKKDGSCILITPYQCQMHNLTEAPQHLLRDGVASDNRCGDSGSGIIICPRQATSLCNRTNIQVFWPVIC